MGDKRVRLAAIVVVAVTVVVGGYLLLNGVPGSESTSSETSATVEPILTPPPATVIKIGVHASLTGEDGEAGVATVQALELAAMQLGGFEIDGSVYEIELVVQDDHSVPADAEIIARRLAEEPGISAVIGAQTAAATLEAVPVFEAEGLPVVCGTVDLPTLTEQGWAHFFRTRLRGDLEGRALADWALELGSQKVAIVDDGGDDSLILGNAVETGLESADIEMQRLDTSAWDLGRIAAAVKEQDPGVLVFTGAYEGVAGLLAALSDAGVDVPLLGGTNLRPLSGVDDDSLEGVLISGDTIAREVMPGYEEFSNAYQAEFGENPTAYGESAYDALAAIIAAAVEAQSTQPFDLASIMRSVEFDGVQGTLGFDEHGDVIVPGGTSVDLIPRYEMKNGSWALLD